MQALETKRLKLIPFSLDLMKATLAEKTRLAGMLGVGVPDDWPGTDLAEALPFFMKNIEENPSDPLWTGLIISKADQMIIGDIGFMGGPNEEGVVEIGYSILPKYRKHGYATEMARCLIDWAFQEQEVKAVIAECLHDNIGSIKVLEKVGMHRLGAEDNMLKWEIRKEE